MDKEFIEQIEHLYDIDIISVQQINSILYMKNYIITTILGKFFLKQWGSKTVEKDIKQQVAIHNMSDMKLIPSILKTTTGVFKIIWNQKWYSLYNYIDSETIDWDNKMEDIDFYNLGERIAELHRILKTIPLYKGASCGNIDLTKKKKEILEVFDQINPSGIQMNDEISRVIDEFEAICMGKKQLLHGDLNRNNLLFLNNRLVGIVDFTDCVVGYPICDLADFCIDVCINLEKEYVRWSVIKEFFSGYCSKNIEKEAIKKAMIYRICGQSVKFYDNLDFYVRRKKIRDYLERLYKKIEIVLLDRMEMTFNIEK